MAYDLMIKNGRVIDGSGIPAFRGDVAVRNGKIVALGKLRDAASRTIDADGLVVAPGFIIITATMMRKSPGTRCAPSPAITAPPPSSSAIVPWPWRRCAA